MFGIFKRKKKMKYKIGDKVRVRTDLEVGKVYGYLTLFDGMSSYIGTKLTITHISKDNTFRCRENLLWWSFDMVEPCETSFTRSDLKTGMTVVLRNGKKKLVLRDTPLGDRLVGEDWESLDCYTKDLKCKYLTSIDIIEVYEPLCNHMLMPEFLNKIEDEGEYKLVWKREEKPVELTMDEIAKKFNVDVKNLKIKK